MKRRKYILTAAIIIIAIVILALSGAVFLGNYIEKELKNRQFGTYKFQSSEANVNIFLRSITIRDVLIENSAANQHFSMPEIKASGIHIFPYLFNDVVRVNNLLIEQAKIKFIQATSDKENKQQEKKAQAKNRKVERILIKKVKIADASVLLQKPSSGDADTLLSIHAGLDIRNLDLFSDKQQLKLKDHSAEQVEIQLAKAVYNLPGDLYKIRISSVNFSSEQERLSLENLHFSSRYTKYEIAGKTGAETDWYDIVLDRLLLEGINTNTLLQDTAVVFQTALLKGLDATIFRDKRPPFPEKPDTKLPMEMLESLPVPVYADSILIKEGNVVYEEHGEESSEPGKITFNSLYATIYNLGTIQDSIDGQTAMAVRAKVMDEALLKANFIFPNNIVSSQYQVSGSMEPLKATAFNPMLIPSAFVKVEEGLIKRMSFDFTYDNNKSEGSLALQYENLNISLLDKEDGSQKTIKTFLTETFVLQQDNLKEDNSYQKGTISFEREKKKSVFNYWWKSLFSGIKDILAF